MITNKVLWTHMQEQKYLQPSMLINKKNNKVQKESATPGNKHLEIQEMQEYTTKRDNMTKQN